MSLIRAAVASPVIGIHGIAVLVLIEGIEVALRDLLEFISSVGFKYYLAAITIYILSTLAWAFRWWFILRRVGSPSSLKDVYIAIMGGILVNNISPSLKMGGEGFRAAWLWIKHKVPIDRSILTIFYERLMEAPAVIIVLGIVVAGGIFDNFKSSLIWGLGIGMAGSGFLESIKKNLRDVRTRLRTDVKVLVKDKPLTLTASSIAVLIWIQDVFRFYLIGLAVGIHLTIPEAALLSIGYLLFGLAPTPAGVGFVEGGLTSILVGLGYPVDKAGLLVIGERLISSVISSSIGFALVTASGGIQAFKLAMKIAKEIRTQRV
jgi:uncharacterized membrane protein YbhN (UPF0104 family)